MILMLILLIPGGVAYAILNHYEKHGAAKVALWSLWAVGAAVFGIANQ